MHHDGSGAVQDPLLAFAWMAVAAERGDHGYARLRDRYWKELDADQHADARARTRELRAEYGDSTALPRLQRSIRMARHEATGSRLGYSERKSAVSGKSVSIRVDTGERRITKKKKNEERTHKQIQINK